MPLAHRRSASHAEPLANQWGILDTLEPLLVRNLSTDGMLVESPNPLEIGSIHEFQLADAATSVRVRAAVRHVSPLRHASAERYFLVGLEFLDLNTQSSAAVERWLNQQPAQSGRREA